MKLTKETLQNINGTVCIVSGIALYYLSFLLTLKIGLDVISAGGTLFATGLAFFGLSAFFKNQLVEFETKIMKKIEEQNENK